MNRILFLSLPVMYIYLAFHLKPWQRIGAEFGMIENVFSLLTLVTFTGLVISCVGVAARKKWAFTYLFVCNIFFLIGGVIAVYIAWILWFGKDPGVLDRIKSALLPFLIGVLIPTALIYYSFKKSRKNR